MALGFAHLLHGVRHHRHRALHIGYAASISSCWSIMSMPAASRPSQRHRAFSQLHPLQPAGCRCERARPPRVASRPSWTLHADSLSVVREAGCAVQPGSNASQAHGRHARTSDSRTSVVVNMEEPLVWLAGTRNSVPTPREQAPEPSWRNHVRGSQTATAPASVVIAAYSRSGEYSSPPKQPALVRRGGRVECPAVRLTCSLGTVELSRPAKRAAVAGWPASYHPSRQFTEDFPCVLRPLPSCRVVELPLARRLSRQGIVQPHGRVRNGVADLGEVRRRRSGERPAPILASRTRGSCVSCQIDSAGCSATCGNGVSELSTGTRRSCS